MSARDDYKRLASIPFGIVTAVELSDALDEIDRLRSEVERLAPSDSPAWVWTDCVGCGRVHPSFLHERVS